MDATTEEKKDQKDMEEAKVEKDKAANEEDTTTKDEVKAQTQDTNDKHDTPKKSDETNTEKDYSDHLLVLQHGLHGNQHDFDFLKAQMEKQYKGLIVFSAISNASYLKTQDGITNAGDRLTKEILELLPKKPSIKKISIIGHSLGGIISRYAVGKLYDAQIFTTIKPVLFMTIASPNVGSRRPMRGAFNKFVSQVTSRLLQKTGTELMLEDETPEGVPLLVLLARKETSYMKGLALFESRILYSNVKSDVQVPYCTAAIVHKNPYRGENARKVTLSKKYPHIIEYEEKEETTLEVDKEDLADIKAELLGDGKESKENLGEYTSTWHYGEMKDNDNNDDASNEKLTNTEQNNKENDKDSITRTTSSSIPISSSPTRTIPINIANSPSKRTSSDITNPKTSTPPSTSPISSAPNSATNSPIKRKDTSDANKGPAISETVGVDAKNASIPKEEVLEKLFAKDLKGDHLMEILKSLQTLTWKRYDVYFETWFLAHTHVVVKRSWVNTAGSDVVRHIVDHFTP